jgi:hypothetical protein
LFAEKEIDDMKHEDPFARRSRLELERNTISTKPKEPESPFTWALFFRLILMILFANIFGKEKRK